MEFLINQINDAEMGALDSVLAVVKSFPDTCEIEKSYLIRCSQYCCTRIGSSLRGFDEERFVISFNMEPLPNEVILESFASPGYS